MELLTDAAVRTAALAAEAHQAANRAAEEGRGGEREGEKESERETWKSDDFVGRSGIHFLLRLAASPKWCTPSVVKEVGNFARDERTTALVAERATRYGKRTLIHLAARHTDLDDRLGRALVKQLVEKDSTSCTFGKAHLVSLLSLLVTPEIPNGYRRFAWWALGKAADSEPNRLPLRVDSRRSKVRETLLASQSLWTSFFLSLRHEKEVQREASKLFLVLADDRTVSFQERSQESVQLLLSWIKVSDNSIRKHALKALLLISREAEVRKLLVTGEGLSLLLELARDSTLECDRRALMELLAVLSAEVVNNEEEGNTGYPFDMDTLSVLLEGEEEAPELGAWYQDHVAVQVPTSIQRRGWLDIGLLGLHDQDSKGREHAIEFLKNLVSYGKHGPVVLQKWLLHSLDTAAMKYPVYRKNISMQLAQTWTKALGTTLHGAFYRQDEVLDESLQRNALKALGKLTDDPASRRTILDLGALDCVQLLALSTPHYRVKRECCKVIANLTGTEAAEDPQTHLQLWQKLRISCWPQLLQSWASSSSDVKLRHYALRALANIHDQKIRGKVVHYKEGINLLYPRKDYYQTLRRMTRTRTGRFRGSNPSKAEELESQLLAGRQPVDIILVHGLRGGAFVTWMSRREGSEEEPKAVSLQTPSTSDEGVLWPSSWLVDDLEKNNLAPRVISVGYEANVLSLTTPWPTMTLEERAQEILEKLVAAGVGSRPVIFITHSMGGLLLKELMVCAAESAKEEHQELYDSTLATVFYSTPHHGSPIAKLNYRGLSNWLTHPAVNHLDRTERTDELNDRFKAFTHIKCLSLGEAVPWYFNVFVVPPSSSNPGFGEYVLLPNAAHEDICKPLDSTDLRYTVVRDFLSQVLRERLPDKEDQ